MTTPRIPELTVSPRLWALLGATLYSHRPILPITVRELLQNAHDAVLARYPGFTAPLNTEQITFDLHVAETDYQETRLECYDAGSGMPEDIILDKYLCLGASGKDTGVGGWGLAKAAIIGSCTDWQIHTHHLQLTQQDIAAARPIQTTEYLDGTQITLHYQFAAAAPASQQHALTWTPRALADALSYIAHSHSACMVQYHQAHLATQTWHFSPWTLPAEPAGQGGTEDWRWTAYQCSPLDTAEYPALRCYLHNQLTTYAIPSQNHIFWRVNGLVQCSDYTDSPYCWIIDVTTTARPGAPAYPFGPSREKPVADLYQEVATFIQPHELNPLTSAQLRTERDRRTKPEEVWYAGELISSNQPHTPAPAAVSASTTPPPTLRFSTFTVAPPPTRRQATRTSPLNVRMLVRGAHLSRSNPHAPKNVKLQAAWLEVLRVIHQLGKVDEDWGIGFTHLKDTIAERYWHNGAAYYLINPRTARLHLHRPRETLLTMIFEACHEVAHHQHPNHTECFTSYQDHLYRTVIYQISAFDHALDILRGQAAQLELL